MSDAQPDLLRTPLHALHQSLGARLVPFAGYEMPVQYPAGILQEHRHTRAAAGLFDVSHMGQVRLTGDGAAAALERLVPMNIRGLKPGRQRYALFTNEQGGILDDLMICNAGDHFFLVVNAACKQQDIEHLRAGAGQDCRVEPLPDRALLALQGPAAAMVLGRLSAAVGELTFMSAAPIELDGIGCFVTRSGYTGEDGFEISLPAEQAERLARTLLAHDEVAPVGLGARDSLRLEAGLCLYGHDIDAATTPVEAALEWSIQKIRRRGGAREGGFPGADVILEQLDSGAARRRVGLRPEGRAPVREGAELNDADGRAVGRVTSGGFGPTVGAPVAMGYVEASLTEPGTMLQASVRGRTLPVQVDRLPFVTQNYHRG
ncbi:MAG: glycine cleavage system aminomethyltransferase GcvT [Candidatus Competibacterales bacterium]|nr:glycine cleavage system aminomethyltransferase GcvT [Candidatus Competibacterales bacterium]